MASLIRGFVTEMREPRLRARIWTWRPRQTATALAGFVLLAMFAIALLAPWLGTVDPQHVAPTHRLGPPSSAAWFGTDLLGRDLYSRVIFGARISLLVGFVVASISGAAGLLLGFLACFVKAADAVIMRTMDGMMSIPSVLFAIALMAIAGPSVGNVILAITITEIPRVTRLVRSLGLSLREQPFVEAALACGTRLPALLTRHILPSTIGPVAVQMSFVCATAMLLEALLSFLGAGVPPDTPSWGNIIADGRSVFQIRPYLVLFPSLFLSLTVLSVNLLGSALSSSVEAQSQRR
jgi:peptide/nickel transport system permease protein